MHARKFCQRYGLNYVETADLSLYRRRCGKGFAYVDGNGRSIRDNLVKSRINRLAIPPAWTEVYIAEDERAHIQAVGRDSEGRLQYRYHPDWDKARSETKAHRLLLLGSALRFNRGTERRPPRLPRKGGQPRGRTPMTMLDGVPVKTRLPVSAWALAALVTLFSLMSSLMAADGTKPAYQASTTQLLNFLALEPAKSH
jgi:DNA topoisomerase IB